MGRKKQEKERKKEKKRKRYLDNANQNTQTMWNASIDEIVQDVTEQAKKENGNGNSKTENGHRNEAPYIENGNRNEAATSENKAETSGKSETEKKHHISKTETETKQQRAKTKQKQAGNRKQKRSTIYRKRKQKRSSNERKQSRNKREIGNRNENASLLSLSLTKRVVPMVTITDTRHDHGGESNIQERKISCRTNQNKKKKTEASVMMNC